MREMGISMGTASTQETTEVKQFSVETMEEIASLATDIAEQSVLTAEDMRMRVRRIAEHAVVTVAPVFDLVERHVANRIRANGKKLPTNEAYKVLVASSNK